MKREEFLEIFPTLIKNYQPAQEVIAHIGTIELLIVVGPSGVGKTTIIHKVDLPFVLSDVTRSARSGEQPNMDYFFRTDYDRMISEIKERQFVQTTVSPSGDFYATRASSYPVAGPAVMAIVAEVVPTFRQLGFAKTVSVFITPPSYEEWMNRLTNLNISADAWPKRMAEAKRSLEFALKDPEMHFILNDDIDSAVTQIKQLLKGSVDTSREDSAKIAAQELLNSIN